MIDYKYAESTLTKAQIARLEYIKLGFIVSEITQIKREFIFYVTK